MRFGSALPALVAAALVMQIVTTNPRVSAQTPPVSPDSVPKDSQPEAPMCEMCMLPVLAAFAAALIVAPPAVMLVRGDTARRPPGHEVGFAGDHFSIYLVGGGSWEKPGLGWTH